MGGGLGVRELLGEGAPALPGSELTCSTRGCDLGVTAGMLKIPAICGVTLITMDDEGNVVPLLISTWRVRPMISNRKPETTGMLIGAVPSPKFVIVNLADSPKVICAG